nr:acid ceramidase [Quercus suber]
MPTTRRQTAAATAAAAADPSTDPSNPPATKPNLRPRTKPTIAQDFLTNDTSYRPPPRELPTEPPRFIINLALPPEQRYMAMCAALRTEMAGLAGLFDEVVAPWAPRGWARGVSRVLLRGGLASTEETRELRGISGATGVEMDLLVCFNVLLDLFMGCSSGGAAVAEEEEKGERGWKMVHFRTLDWGMPALRRVVVRLDYVLEHGGPVVASSITYAGFVGVLTGVRKGLSLSLNFRAVRKDKGRLWADARYYWHLLLVLFGWRRAIASHLRSALLPSPDPSGRGWKTASFREVLCTFLGSPLSSSSCSAKPIETTACYLCFSDGEETAVLEKDRVEARLRGDSDFIVVTNGDQQPAARKTKPRKDATTSLSDAKEPLLSPAPATALAELLDDAVDRQTCAEQNWQRMVTARLKTVQRPSHMDRHRSRSIMRVDDVIALVQRYPTTNECTHFACVMDAKAGCIRWCRRWKRPVGSKWIREHE